MDDLERGLAGEGVGQRVRAARKLAPGLTQLQLATRMHVSLSLVKAVEQGRVPASPAFVAAAGRALGLSTYDLYGEPTTRFGTERGSVADLETAVMAGWASGDGDVPEPLPSLAERARQVAACQRRSEYDTSSRLMPSLIEDLHNAIRQAPTIDQEHLHKLLAEVYGSAVICLHRLGSPLTGQAAERAAEAARNSGDPLLAALTSAEIGLPLMHRGAYVPAQRITDQVLASIDDVPTSRGKLTIEGYLHLRSAILSARRADADESNAHLREAATCAEHLPELSDLYDIAFCQPNVTIHSVAAAVELGDGSTAITRNKPLPPGTMVSRRGHHHVDLSRAYLLHGDRDKAFDHLNEARRVAPQLTRYHPQVRETLRVLAETDRRRTDTLSGFARWCGLRL